MLSAKPFNSSIFDNVLINGDITLEPDIIEPIRSKSDFDITPPNIKVDPLIQDAIDVINIGIINQKSSPRQKPGSTASLEEEVEALSERERILNQQIKELNAQLKELIKQLNKGGKDKTATD